MRPAALDQDSIFRQPAQLPHLAKSFHSDLKPGDRTLHHGDLDYSPWALCSYFPHRRPTISAEPAAIAPNAQCTAASPDPHFRSIVSPGTEVGQPAPRSEVRAIFADCSPIWVTQPNTTSSMDSAAKPFRYKSSFKTSAPRWSARTPARLPRKRPTGVRTASTITTSFMTPSPQDQSREHAFHLHTYIHLAQPCDRSVPQQPSL